MQTTMHSNSPCQKPLTHLDLQSTLAFPCPKLCPKIMLQSVSVHPSADVFGNRVVLPADVLPAVLQCKANVLFNKRMFAMGLKSREPAPSSPASEKACCSNMMEISSVENIVGPTLR